MRKANMHGLVIVLLAIINFAGLVWLVIGLARWQLKHGQIGEKPLAAILMGYFSISTIILTLPALSVNVQGTLIVDGIFLAIFWGLGYPAARWVHRKFSTKRVRKL